MINIYKLTVLLLISGIFCCGKGDDKNFTRVQKGDFSSSIFETGNLQAVSSTGIYSPYIRGFYQIKLISLETEGTKVKKDQIIGELDKTLVINQLEQKKSSFEISKSDMKKIKVEHENTMKQLNAELLAAEAELKSAEVSAEMAKFESKTAREIAQLRLNIAEIRYKKAQTKIKTIEIVHSEELRINETKMAQLNSDIQLAEKALEMFTLRAPTEGILEYSINRQTGKKIQIGDQLYPFWPIVSLPDMSRMKVLTSINETDIDKIKIGLKVLVRLDAFPKRVFEGHITAVSNICRKKDIKSNIKIFDVEVLLDKVDSILKPGMTVSCEFIIAELKDALFIENTFIQKEGTEYFVYIDGKLKVNVKLGPRNSKYVVIYGNVKAGDRVTLKQDLGKT